MTIAVRAAIVSGVALLSPDFAVAQPVMESLSRGIVVVRTGETTAYVGWRLLATDPANVAFNLYRASDTGQLSKLNRAPLTRTTDFVDGDGRDEIVYGAMVVDDDGKGLFSTGLRHGDALHVGDLDPSRPGLEVFGIHENEEETIALGTPGAALYDARSGEVIWRSEDNTALRIYTTTIPAENRLDTLMHDRTYRIAVAWQNVGYNQPPHPGFFLGHGMRTPPRR